jgi:hypothetical protein
VFRVSLILIERNKKGKEKHERRKGKNELIENAFENSAREEEEKDALEESLLTFLPLSLSAAFAL